MSVAEKENIGSIAPENSEPQESIKRQIFRSVLVAGFITYFVARTGLPFLFMLLAFAVSIVIHEAGHFFVAKRGGMKATEFFVGFGPKIFSFTKGDTTYGLKAVPLGAYVKIIGMSTAEPDVAPEDESRAYRARPFRWRFATVVAGPGANILLAFFILLFVSIFIGKTDPAYWSIKAVVPGAPAEAAGIQSGEKIVAIDGQQVGNYDDLVARIAASDGQAVTFNVVNTNGEERLVTTPLAWRFSESAAQHYGAFTVGDTPVQISDKPVGTFESFATEIASLSENETAMVVFYRGGNVLAVDVPRTEIPDPSVTPNGFLGVSPEFEVIPTQPAEGISESLFITKEIVVQSVLAFKDVFSPSSIASYGEKIVAAVSGEPTETKEVVEEKAFNLRQLSASGVAEKEQPEDGRIVSIVGIFRLGTQAAEAGAAVFLMMWALLNVFLATVNMIPLLPFDGGHAAIAMWEKLRGMATRNPEYRVDIRKLMPLSYAVIAFFVVLSLSAMWLDIVAPIRNPF